MNKYIENHLILQEKLMKMNFSAGIAVFFGILSSFFESIHSMQNDGYSNRGSHFSM